MSIASDVAANLRAIVTLTDRLLTQAIHSANDPLMPGGKAMVELAYVAKPSQFAEQIDYMERVLDVHPDLNHEDDSWEPPLQTLLFWSEEWRNERGYPLEGRRPTVVTEANFLRGSLEWAWENEPHFANFAEDIKTARRRIEDTLSEGERVAFRGVPCMYETCRGASLIRKTVPTRDKDGNKVWKLSDWHCPKCKRSWSEEDYTRNIYAAVLRTKIEQLNNDLWCTVDHAATRVGRPEGTLRSWMSRGEVASACILANRKTFVRYDDVEQRDKLAKQRHAARLTAIESKRMTAA